MTEQRFTILKSSWGISILFRGELVSNYSPEPTLNTISINDQMYLNLERFLPIECIEYIVKGIKWFLNQKELSLRTVCLLRLSEIEFGLCDFQQEGLFYGVASWMARLFDTSEIKFECYFSKEENKYVFPNKEYMLPSL